MGDTATNRKIVIICGPSGSGKNSLIDLLLKENGLNFVKVVTCTTRPNSRQERAGQDYEFLKEKEFEKRIDSGYFLEYENTHGYYYGTPKSSFFKNANYLAHIDIRGAINIKKTYPETLIIFINTPIYQIKRRLKARGEEPTKIKVRLATANREIASMKFADVIIDNIDNKLDEAYTNLFSAIEKYLNLR